MDVFEGLDGLGSSGKKKMSLAEQLETKKKSMQNAFDGIDLLGGSSLQPERQQPVLPQMPVAQQKIPAQSPKQDEDDDLFGIFTSAPPPKVPSTHKPSQPVPKPQSAADDFGTNAGSSIPSRTGSSTTSRVSSIHTTRRSSIESDSSAGLTDASVNFSENGPDTTSSLRSDGRVSDRKLAQLIDMGFEPKDANRALTAMNGDVKGSVSWLMAEAQGLPLPKPRAKHSDFADIQAAASQLGASMFSKASSLFSKGKREIEKAYNQYQGSAATSSSPSSHYSGQPAWMRGRELSGSESNFTERTMSNKNMSHRESPVERRVSSDATKDLPNEESRARANDEERRTRPSRAELFKRQQEARKNGGLASERTGDAQPDTTAAVSSSAVETTKVPVSVPTEEIDLLNLSGPSVATTHGLSSAETDMYSASRQLGSDSFKRGNYEDAIIHYTAALQLVSSPTLQRALLLSNRSAAYIKAGNTRGAFDDSREGINLIPNRGINQTVEDVNMQDIWVKLVTRNAQSAETMEKFNEALSAWQLLLDNGHASPAVLDAKRRCLKALDPEATKRAENVEIKKKSNRRGWGTTGALPTSEAGKAALEKIKSSHEQQRQEELERDGLRERVNQRIDSWKSGNEDNLRVLLATLQTVLWSECQWQPVAGADLVVPKKVRVVYMKAVARTHPDKVPASAPTEVKMIAQGVFVVIQHAWEKFKVENNM